MKSRIDLYEGDNDKRFVIGASGTNPLYVIAMNPSVADEELFDQTVMKLFGLSYLFGFDGCIMFNLIPIREPDSTKLENELDAELMNKNIETIINSIPSDATVLATWGDISKNTPLKTSLFKVYDGLKEKNCDWKCVTYTDRKVGEKFNEYSKKGLTDSGHPRHVSFLKQTSFFTDFNIDEYVDKLK
ncbi:DUF1643 domain-containing protein [Poseidonibacter ostreae]|uniref:DUF1643 domain-containing protein n=1 Tax=Poseidonibacter ostreae TaxID=2654171 RepID=A0A6L4WTT8_9BACT|nr:DUF1643 domain-containing protein [Poseidonibacter ostreae]KAB7889538.1 DUF1643 domain-containing protein [Poseidonibacter ostreae]